MKSSLNLFKKSPDKKSKGLITFLLIFIFAFSILSVPTNEARAQFDAPLIIANDLLRDTGKTVEKKVDDIKVVVKEKLGKLLLKSGALAFQQTIRTAVSKIAYDTATWLGSGDKGQKPLFITQDWGAYLVQVGDEAAGEFIETFTSDLTSSLNNQTVALECQKAYIECTKSCPVVNVCKLEGKTNCDKDASLCIDSCKVSAATCNTNGGTGSNGTTSSSTFFAISNNSGIAIPSVSVCQPSSLEASMKISLGLVNQTRPGAPNCTASTMVQNWGDEAKRLTDYEDPYFINKITGIFNPVSNDLGIAMKVSSDMVNKQVTVNENNKLLLAANNGWKDKVNIAKELIGVPGDAEKKRDAAGNLQNATFGQVTGDILVDAASIFLNQVALTSFNNLMANLGKKAGETNNYLSNPNADPGILYGEKIVKEAASFIIKPNFGVRADYDILADLSSCPDKSNPGPTNCAIDSQFMQGITDKRTVAEAIKEGYINGNWSLTKDSIENAYSLRSVSLLRKYRVLPIGWEEAVNRAYASSTAVKKFTVNDLVSCFDLSDTYNQYSQDFNVRDQAWCRGLVDPNWVLKAPLNYCSKEGIGAQVISLSAEGGSYSLTRAEDYCADEKTCIKEKSDGSCEVYGYCNEEKRTWNFSSDSCEPINNTCNSFTNTSSGRQVSYLENTLNYGECNVDTAGCRQYSVFGAYASTTGTVSWDANKSAYFNKNISNCNGKDEGCNELIRIKPTWGTNLVMDAGFFNDAVNSSSTSLSKLNDLPLFFSSNSYQNYRKAAIVESSLEPGDGNGKILKLEADGSSQSDNDPVQAGVYSSPEESLLPGNFELIKDESYTFSADVYVVSGEAIIYLGEDKKNTYKVTSLGSWQHLSLTRTASDSFNKPYFGINVSSALSQTGSVKAYVRNLKFEVSNFETQYDIYGVYRFFEKIIPPYLEKACYNGTNGEDYSLRSDAPAICNNFSRKCNSTEVGCELFTNLKNKLNVSAQVASSDYCPKECVGYDIYISKASYFNDSEAENIIPSTASVCSSEAVGCSEFTNLDEINQGGEKKEYYSALKHCIKPSQGSCSSFYSWEGTSSGYQLRLYNLEKDISRESTGEPKEYGSVDNNVCNAEIYNKPSGDPKYNPDCREFYNSAGKVSYHLMSRTITCSDECRSYRLSGENLSGSCLNGGEFDTTLKACIYKAIPGEGKTCSAVENGCREYNGADGNNTQILSSYNFETGDQGWSSNCVGGLGLSTISNNKDGHSIFYKNIVNGACSEIGTEEPNSVSQKRLVNQVFASDNIAAQLKVGTSVSKGKSYTIRFIAKSKDGNANLKVYFYNNNPAKPEKAYFNSGSTVVKGGGEWGIYQINLDNLNHEVDPQETLVITSDNAFYFDEVVITEITSRYYLIKNTSQVPDICYYDMADNFQGVDHNLGCSAYSDRAGNTHTLRKFSKLCSSSSVGCEQMIDTKNYTPYGSNIWGDTNKNNTCDADETDCIKVNGDSIIYAIFDESKKCNPADKSCSRLGQGVAGGADWSDVFKKNNPDLYDKNLCGQAELNCEEWSLSDGSKSYFKDPGNDVCQYRESRDASVSGKAWYKVPVKRCDSNESGLIDGTEKTSKVCSSNNDCSGKACIIDNNDYACSTSNLKTFGLGGANNSVSQPDKQVGLCEANASGCTEYIDPVSKFSPNLVPNPGFETSGSVIENWDGNKQTISLEKNKLYVFSTSGTEITDTVLSFDYDVRVLLNDNKLGSTAKTLSISNSSSKGIIFYSGDNAKTTITGGEINKLIEIKESIISYQLKENIDNKSCNGTISFDNGCVLFNERSIGGANGLSSLSGKWDAASSTNQKTPVVCSSSVLGSCTANQLIKVRPNRTCAKWLDCISYVTDPKTGERTCYAVGQCNRLDDDKNCIGFEDVSTSTIRYSNDGLNQNASGYYLLDKYHLSNMREVGLNTDAHYDFEDSIPTLSCKRTDGGTCTYKENIAVDFLQRGPNNPPASYPAHGASYLKVPAAYLISPQSEKSWVTVLPNKKYFINFLVNTEKSGTGAKVKIVTKNIDKVYSRDYVFYSNNGWTRQIFSFDPGMANQIRIELGAVATTSDTNVYFDDINIEPVLEVGQDINGNKNYVSRECRLYPTSGSLTCVNKNNNVLKDGLEGYCLVHDSKNKDVCLMWYPVDKISSTQLNRASSGYKGKFPLNYCTEVNGNFDLVKKLTFSPVWLDSVGNDASLGNKVHFCKSYENGTWSKIGSDNWPNNSVANNHEPAVLAKAIELCNGNYRPIVAFGQEKDSINSYAKIACVPITSKVLEFSKKEKKVVDMNECNNIVYYDGLAKFDGIINKVPYIITNSSNSLNDYDKARNGEKVCQDNIKEGATEPWCTAGYEGLDENTSLDGSVRVLDYNTPPADEEGLKYISGNDPDKVYRLTCNHFAQVVDNNGDNKAWAYRVSENSPYLSETPPYFRDGAIGFAPSIYHGDHNISAYGRNRQDAPFGAAIWPDSFNLLSSEGAVKLRNQYSSKNREDVLAGRPYGCSNYQEPNAGGCENIGYCSLDPNVYCLDFTFKNTIVQLSVDDQYVAYLNNDELGSKNSVTLDNYDVSLRKAEKNVLAIKAVDKGGSWGIAAAIKGVMSTNQVDGWKCSPNLVNDWFSIYFDDSSWSNAVFSNTSCSNCGGNDSGYQQIWDANSNSAKKTVYCRYTFYNNFDKFVSKKTCAEGGLGTCVPLWSKYLGAKDYRSENVKDYQAIISNLFLKLYNSYSYNAASESYEPGDLSIPGENIGDCGGTRTDNAFCSVAPSIANIKFNGVDKTNDFTINITKKDIYNLSFTTKVDPEQKPLKKIHINWGDGMEQIITGQDSIEDIKNPHLFYHYYSSTGQKKVEIKIEDNWNIPNK